MSALETRFVKTWGKFGKGRIPKKQYRFHPVRRFRFDFAWPAEKVAVEIDGFGLGHGIGRNLGVAIATLSQSNERQNLAMESGWIVLRYTSRQLGSEKKRRKCCEQILRVLENRRDEIL